MLLALAFGVLVCSWLLSASTEVGLFDRPAKAGDWHPRGTWRRTSVSGILVLRKGFVLVGIGSMLGVAGAVSLRTVVATELYGVGPLDPLVIGGIAIVFGAVAPAVCVMPARRAIQLNPAIVLSEQ